MLNIPSDDPLAISVVSVIRKGSVNELEVLLLKNHGLATSRIVDSRGTARSLLHIATDWPGHFPEVAKTITCLIRTGAEANASIIAPAPQSHFETALHWAASSDDVAAIDSLLDGGADIEAPGAVFTGGTPMSDAVVFAQWRAARRLLERGARTTIWQAAALGLLERVQACCSTEPRPAAAEITNAFWHACRGNQRLTAEFLLQNGADRNWIGHDRKTPLDAAKESAAKGLVDWLHSQGAKTAQQL